MALMALTVVIDGIEMEFFVVYYGSMMRALVLGVEPLCRTMDERSASARGLRQELEK